jgi:hypothetical protein
MPLTAMAMNTRRWRSVRSSLDSTAHRGDQVTPLGVLTGAGREAVGQPLPVRLLRAAAGRCQKCRPSLVDLQDTGRMTGAAAGQA